ncbi:DUF3558 domain-containing protein [Nocardia sp. NBC_00508]|uniref:DUF3558 domain-containing protein n=1 Tax=Nocardia sp. NBC_00508 TaxID=2975992 RepID=UPI002E820D9B|nr:DUF3558 domain-containing protein [Nocardia sp. NBC_00508]WUD66486.1 DUF3558 domain-containing protein [Nocardia sp. NBC_00508]
MLLGFVLAASTVGCGTTTGGSATTSTTAAKALFNPCTEISDDVLRAAGLDPATEEPGIAGVDQSGWEICSWDAPKYLITVFSTGRTVSEFERKPGNIEFKDVTVAGRQGRQFKVDGATKDLGCDILFPASQGVTQLRILNKAAALGDLTDDSCTMLYRAGDSLVPAFPN